nr:peptidoglycan-binding protein [Oscillospiraceae bacterium]
MSKTYAQLSLGGNNDQETVKQLQKLLNEKNNAGLQVDGIFGKKTKQAVLDYQSANGLQVDGIVGTKTWGALLKAADKQPAEEQVLSPAESIRQQMDTLTANKPGEFVFADQALLDMTEQAIRDRGAFAYDPNADALYRRYKDSYITQGKQAMEDTMGQAAAMTGGYGSSYAQTAGQQAYQGYLQELNDVLPQLEALAYEKYSDETDRLRENYQLLADQRETALDAHQAAQKQYNTELQNLHEQYQDALTRQDEEFMKMVTYLRLGYSPTQAELAAAGLTPELAR